MKTQILPVLVAATIAVLVPIGGATAKAIECSVAPNSKAYWSWRLIDGRKCWYVGKAMIPKSMLQWPTQAPVKPVAAPVTVATEKRNDFLDAQARLTDEENSFESRWRDENSFESRWRARIIHE